MQSSPSAGPIGPSLPTALVLLWLAGIASRITILAVPPAIRLIHDDLHMTETQVGALIGLPLIMFAVAAIPGSLLISRIGATVTITLGMFITAFAAAARGGAPNLALLYAATIVMGCGIAIMQPAMQTLVREWTPQRVGLATALSTNGMMVAIACASTLTIPLVLPLVGQSWRLELVVWSVPALIPALLFLGMALRLRSHATPADAMPRRWWPDWKNPVIWLLGLTFGCNNASYYAMNAFIPDYLHSLGRADLTGAALGWLNTCQFVASMLLLVTAEKLQRHSWPYLVFGPLVLLGVAGVVLGDGFLIVLAAGFVGFSLSMTFVVTMSLPPVLSPPGEIHRIAGGMFTISYAVAVILPIICGAVWDLTGIPWTAFVPVALSALTLTTLGFFLSLRKPAITPATSDRG